MTSDAANADWVTTECQSCCRHVAKLLPRVALAAAAEITVPRALAPDPMAGLWPYELTFDGGARELFDLPKVAGAGVSLWRHSLDGSAPFHLASAVLALPDDGDSQFAEVVACRVGLQMLARLSPDVRSARVVGDNLAAVRYGAGTGRFRTVALQATMEAGLGPLAARGWLLTWQAVRRRLNVGSDRLATLGVFWAAELKARGTHGVHTHTVWHNAALPTPDPPHLPTLPGQGLAHDRVLANVERLEAAERQYRRRHRRS